MLADVVAQPRAVQSRYRCVATLSGHRSDARRRRPVEPRGRSLGSTPRRAQVNCVVELPNGDVMSGSDDGTLKVWEDVERKLARGMARLVAQHRLLEMNVAGRLIAAFL